MDVSPLTENCDPNTQAIIDAVKALIASGEWDVFSGTKLTYTVNEDGTVTVNKTAGALVTMTAPRSYLPMVLPLRMASSPVP